MTGTAQAQAMSTRSIIHRSRGAAHGPITRLVSPSDIGELIKPFIFLDYIDVELREGFGFGFHPHSGIATLTHQFEADVAYEDTSGQKGLVKANGIEWMSAGGVWHQGSPVNAPRANGFQLWVALPPGIEDGAAQGQYVPPEQVQEDGPVRVLLGSFGAARSPIAAPSPIDYFRVQLRAGEHWRYTPPAGYTVAWAFAHRGEVAVAGTRVARELVVFDASEAAIEFEAINDAAFMFGAARPHAYPLISGYYSVHTNAQSLRRGEARIREIGDALRRAGRLA